MNFNQMVLDLSHHFTPLNASLFVALVVTTIMAENERVKASSIYGLFKTLLFTFKDQVWPSPVIPVVPTTVPPVDAPKV